MLKICLCSDNHGDLSQIARILSDNPACDYYFHAGDVMAPPEAIAPFVAVEGNNDWQFEFPRERIFEIADHRILLMHGHQYTYSANLISFFMDIPMSLRIRLCMASGLSIPAAAGIAGI